jgi:hypothetical protein
MEQENRLPIVFAYWKGEELMGFRADTFGTISMTHPKIYSFSQEQVETVINNTRSSLNWSGSNFMKLLESKGYNDQPIFEHTSNTERTLRSWKEFEVRVHPFIESTSDEILMKVAIDNLKAPIQCFKFVIPDCEN